MKKIFNVLALAGSLLLVAFCTWQLFLGNFEAAFSTVPVLLAMYFLLLYSKK